MFPLFVSFDNALYNLIRYLSPNSFFDDDARPLKSELCKWTIPIGEISRFHIFL